MMLLAPLGAGADHLKALAMVARMLRTDSIVEQAATRRASRAGCMNVLTRTIAKAA
jgi:PTS system nitrogen regulatory IIA component